MSATDCILFVLNYLHAGKYDRDTLEALKPFADHRMFTPLILNSMKKVNTALLLRTTADLFELSFEDLVSRAAGAAPKVAMDALRLPTSKLNLDDTDICMDAALLQKIKTKCTCCISTDKIDYCDQIEYSHADLRLSNGGRGETHFVCAMTLGRDEMMGGLRRGSLKINFLVKSFVDTFHIHAGEPIEVMSPVLKNIIYLIHSESNYALHQQLFRFIEDQEQVLHISFRDAEERYEYLHYYFGFTAITEKSIGELNKENFDLLVRLLKSGVIAKGPYYLRMISRQ